jgi:hypothetical protein
MYVYIAAIYAATLILSAVYWGYDEARHGRLFVSSSPPRRGGAASYGSLQQK